MIKKLLLTLLISAFVVTPCFAGASRDFDGTDDQISIAVAGSESVTNFTAAAWVNADAVGLYYGIAENRQGGGLRGLLISAILKVTYCWENTADEYGADSGLSLTLNAWHFVAVRVTPTEAIVYMSPPGGGAFSTWTNTKTHNSKEIKGTWTIGNDPSDSLRFFNGRIAYVHFYNRTVTEAELTTIMYKPGSISDGLYGYWPLWGVNSPEIDLSGNGNTGTVTGATESSDGPPVFIGAGGN